MRHYQYVFQLDPRMRFVISEGIFMEGDMKTLLTMKITKQQSTPALWSIATAHMVYACPT